MAVTHHSASSEYVAGGGGGGSSAGMAPIVLRPLQASFPSSSFAVPTVRNNHDLLAFGDSTAQTAYFIGHLPAGYQGGGLVVEIHSLAAAATTGDVMWEAAFERISGQDLDSDSFAAGVTGAAEAHATNGVETVTSIALSDEQIDGLQAGEAFRLRIKRLPTDAADTMAGDAQVLLVVLREAE